MTTHVRADVERVKGKLSGLIPLENIRAVDFPRPAKKIIEGFKAVPGPTPVVSDVLDKLGINGVVPASVLQPMQPDTTLVGVALTIRYVPERFFYTQAVLDKRTARFAHPDACAICQPGDVMVVDAGGSDVSVLGDMAALNAQKAGFVGAVLEGAVRDVDTTRSYGFPVWSRHATPRSGRLRLEAVEINGVVSIGGVRVEPGDIIIADASGVAVVPLALAQQVLQEVQALVAKEQQFTQALQKGTADWSSVLGEKKG